MAPSRLATKSSEGAATRFGSATIFRSGAPRCLWRDGAQRASASVELAGEAADQVSPLASEERAFSSRIDPSGGKDVVAAYRSSGFNDPKSFIRAK